MTRLRTPALAFGLAIAALSGLSAQEEAKKKEDPVIEKGKASVEVWINQSITSDSSKDPAPVRLPRKVENIDLDVVRKAFPDDRFYSIHFKKMPRPDMLPSALQTVKLVYVRPDNSVERIADLESLKKIIANKFNRVQDEGQARSALLVCLRLSQEYYQDGDLNFTTPKDAISILRQGDQLVASGKAIVTDGGKGEVRVSLTFGPSGTLKADDVKIMGRVLPDNVLK